MSVGHIYHYFENKEAIVEAIVERDLARSLAFLDELARASDASAAILDLVQESLSHPAGRERMLLRMEVLAEASRTPRVAAKVREADALARQRFLEVLRSQPAFRNVPEPDLNARADGIVAILEGLTLRALRNPGLDVARVSAEMRPALAALLR